jgi:hypothetical protein
MPYEEVPVPNFGLEGQSTLRPAEQWVNTSATSPFNSELLPATFAFLGEHKSVTRSPSPPLPFVDGLRVDVPLIHAATWTDGVDETLNMLHPERYDDISVWFMLFNSAVLLSRLSLQGGHEMIHGSKLFVFVVKSNGTQRRQSKRWDGVSRGFGSSSWDWIKLSDHEVRLNKLHKLNYRVADSKLGI